jgi:K+-transporting ATPase ATPase C chain
VLQSNITTYLGLNCRSSLTTSGACPGSAWYDPTVTSAARVPVDAADTSASGIDPDISVANADIQAHRVAAVRHLPPATVDQLVSKYTHGRGLGFSGEPGVNVLELNLALDRLAGVH